MYTYLSFIFLHPPILPLLPPLGASAFDSWIYFINYTELGSSSSVQSMNTSSLSLTLTPLQPGSLYEFTISATGPGAEVANPRVFVFTTKMEGGWV